MALLILNAGSSSLKYRLYRHSDLHQIAAGTLDGLSPGAAHNDHGQAIEQVIAEVRGALPANEALTAIGHRVVHGGDTFSRASLIDEGVLSTLDSLAALAPLHNPPALAIMRACQKHFPALPQVAVFDTAFHHTLPERARCYPLPQALCQHHAIRRFGFHGISHGYVARQAGEYLGRDNLKLISLHLGNGASAAAIDSGRCIDTSMGLTPLEGLMMGTRAGDLDPGIIFHLARNSSLSLTELETLLTKESGLLGLCGSADMRDVMSGTESGDPRALLALDLYTYRVRKYIGAYAAALGGLDALIFTAGIGEHHPTVRARICEGLEFLGIDLDPERNMATRAIIGPIQREGATTAVLVVPTNEELEIARQVRQLLDVTEYAESSARD